MKMKPLVLVGGGGHCKSVIDVAESAGYTILGILDKPELVGTRVLDYEVIGVDDDIPQYVDKAEFVITVGQIKSSVLRQKLAQLVQNAGGKLATIIAPDAYVSKYATIGEGTVVMHKAFVNAGACVGSNCIINTLANIEHDVKIGDFCHISTGAMINGGVIIDGESFIGSQSVINQGITICDYVVVASGTVICKDITIPGVYMKILKSE
jgi:sugar O-acyltransferase (sialic acid O-acetyltransferase NeuD family)